MYIYADESGHTGRHIFNEPTFYFQGAILAEQDPEPFLFPAGEAYLRELGLERLHANELKPDIVEKVAEVFLQALSDINWVFHLTVIEKPYLSVTKFVDSIFDSYENKGARWLWYNHELFRHSLCCLFDSILIEQKKKDFWEAYLSDNYDGISSIVRFALDQLDMFSLDKRLCQVAKDGLLFALENPEEITLLASKTRKSYKGHTPNMVAFSSLIQAVHKFCKEYKVSPKSFIHDPQTEFGSTMREYHKIFSRMSLEHSESGFQLKAEEVTYDLGEFALKPSKSLMSLQAVDVFLWLSQRDENNTKVKELLLERMEPFYISRLSSEMIVAGWLYKISNLELTEEQIAEGMKTIEKLESVHYEELETFKIKKLLETKKE